VSGELLSLISNCPDSSPVEKISLDQVCGKAVADQDLTVFLRSRFCRKCFKAQCVTPIFSDFVVDTDFAIVRNSTISSKGLEKAWPDLHSLASQCVRYVDRKSLLTISHLSGH